MGSWPSDSTLPTSRASGRCSRSSTSAPPTASSPGSAGTRTVRAPTSGRCCSACSTTRARSITSGSRRRSRGTSAPPWPRSWRRCARTPSTNHPWREWAEWATTGDADASGQRLPGATSRWNRGKDLSWEPLAHRTRRRGRLRPPPGRPVPPRHDVQALAPGQAAGGVPLRPARGERAVPAGQHLR